MRFANNADQGLILGNGPVMSKQKVQSVESFRDMITDLAEKVHHENIRHAALGPGDRLAVCDPR